MISSRPGDPGLLRQASLLRDHAGSVWTSFSGPDDAGSWWIEVDPTRARHFEHVRTIADYLEAQRAIHAAHEPRFKGLAGAPAVSAVDLASPILAEPADARHPSSETSLGRFGENASRMSLSPQTIAVLARPFEGGGGPTHSSIEFIFRLADASEYLGEGSKRDRVFAGLRALRDGRHSSLAEGALPPDHDKLQLVARELAARLIAEGSVQPEDVSGALESEHPAESRPEAVGSSPVSATSSSADQGEPAAAGVAEDRRNVMVVHGQDGEAARAMFDWLRAINLRPREWNQLVQASGGSSPFIGEVLEQAFRQAQAVVVLFTPDERVQVRDELAGDDRSWRLQARPNVLFEAGMAFATHPSRTVLVVLGEQELPSDLAGRHYVRLGTVGALRDLAKRLERAGCAVDDSGNDWLDTGRFPGRSGVVARPH